MHILKQGKTLSFVKGKVDSLEKIPKGNWLVKYHQKEGFYLEQQEDFELPAKIYGDLDTPVQRYIKTFTEGSKNLGILLLGLKGTGKSLEARKFCIDAGLPVLILETAYSGTEFIDFIAKIDQEIIIFIDEFEKRYRAYNSKGPSQEDLLSLMDGVYKGKKVFLLTANDEHAISDKMNNRTGRIHYRRYFDKLSADVIDDVIKDLLVNHDHKDELKQVLSIIGDVNMDILVTLIRECNDYEESPRESVRWLNIDPESKAFKVSWKEKSAIISAGSSTKLVTYQGVTNENPLIEDYISISGKNKADGKDRRHRGIYISMGAATVLDNGDIVVEYEGINFTFTPSKRPRFTF